MSLQPLDATALLSSVALDLNVQPDVASTNTRVAQLAVKLFEGVAADIVRPRVLGRYSLLVSTNPQLSSLFLAQKETRAERARVEHDAPSGVGSFEASSQLIVPLHDGVCDRGILRIFAPEDHWRPDMLLLAEAYAGQAAYVMRRAELERSIRGLTEALEGNRNISMAAGVLMATNRVTAEAAMTVLTKASQNSNRKLRDVADIVLLYGRLPTSAELR